MLRRRIQSRPRYRETPYKQIILQPYATPIRKDMAVVLVFYNPASSVRILQNILLVKNKLEAAGIPFFIAELAYDTTPFAFPAAENIFQYRSDSYLFYKENLINLAEQHIHSEFTKICALDADILFDKPGWYDRISETLETHDLCQCFSQATWLDLTYTTAIQTSLTSFKGQHPGFGWACRREFFRYSGFPEFAIVGHGDSIIAGYARKINTVCGYNEVVRSYIPTRPPTLKATDMVDLGILHLYHGSLSNRQYGSRSETMSRYLGSIHQRNVTDILMKREDGLLVIKPEYKDAVNGFMRQYFYNRSDDSL